jgi:hypothetical protein
MIRHLTILSVVLAITQTAVPVPGVATDPKTDTQKTEKKSSPNAQNPPATTPTASGPQEGYSHAFTYNVPKESSKDGWDKAGILANYLLVVVGFGGIAVAYLTLKKIERQTKAGEDAAIAAKDGAEAARFNAQALINSERPWLLAKLASGEDGSVYVVIRNCGRTPAKVTTATQPRYQIVPNGELLPKVPDYGNKIARRTILLQEGEEKIASISDDLVRDYCQRKGVLNRVIDGGDEFYMFGVITYEDLLNTGKEAAHESRWCCRYFPSPATTRFTMGGPDEYSGYT